MVYHEPAIQGNKLSKKWSSITYGKCNNKGYNSRTCKGKGDINQKRTRDTRGNKNGVANEKGKDK